MFLVRWRQGELEVLELDMNVFPQSYAILNGVDLGDTYRFRKQRESSVNGGPLDGNIMIILLNISASVEYPASKFASYRTFFSKFPSEKGMM